MKIPATPPDFQATLAKIGKDPKKAPLLFSSQIDGVSVGPYEHWEKVRFKPAPEPLAPDEAWVVMKMKRLVARRPLPFSDTKSQKFFYTQIGDFQRALHEIDSNARGLVGMPGAAATSENRDVYLQKSLLEEPFSSSVLEGAATTREVARKMIEEGRKPKTVGERMVLNNYRAMSFIREHRHEGLTPARVLELHRILTLDTLEKPEKVGVFRTAADDVRVVESLSGETLHMPPPAGELPARLQALCDFANESDMGKAGFLHPVIRAIVLHFMLAYDHPFWDGNGRCARALFYWCVLKHGYWLLEYVSISAVIMRAPTKYGMAFLYSETDEGDLTYFIDHQLGVIEQSLADLQKYLVEKTKELGDLGKALGRLESQLNRRQLGIVQLALKSASARFEIQQHADSHHVSYLTARADLESLAKRRLLRKTKEGVKSVFLVPPDLRERLGLTAKPVKRPPT
ncbi:MAG: Fic family protein [Rhizomicrobium sp.]